MNTKSTVKVIKKEKPKELDISEAVDTAAGPTGWSKAVRSWVTEFQQQRRGEILPAFNSLFKDGR